MRSWKKRWEEELDAKIPALDEKVKNAPIITAQKQEKKSFFARVADLFSLYKKRILSGVAACTAAILALCIALPLFNQTVKEAVISVEINPCAVFSVDEEGIVTAVVAGNADADVILSGGRVEQMKGKTVEQATKIFVDYAARLGYLNLSATDKTAAVRVSGCGNENALKRVGENLEAYFQDKGAYAAVVQESVSSEDLCRRAGVEIKEKIDELTENINALPTLYAEREIDTEEEIQGNLTEITANLLSKNKTKLMQNALDILEIYNLNTQIEEHDDNDGVWGVILNYKDYWHIKDGEYTGEFAALLADMENKLTAYKANYGVLLESWTDMYGVLDDYQDMDVEAYIDELLVDFDFLACLTAADLLKNVGVKIPDTSVEDWIYNFGAYLDDEFARLANEAKQIYYEARETLTQSVYKDYTRELEREYGSLSAYWNSLQK